MNKIEQVKKFLQELLKDSQLEQLYNEYVIERYFLKPYSETANAYKAALNIYDELVTN